MLYICTVKISKVKDMANYYTQEELDKLSNRAFENDGFTYIIKSVSVMHVIDGSVSYIDYKPVGFVIEKGDDFVIVSEMRHLICFGMDSEGKYGLENIMSGKFKEVDFKGAVNEYYGLLESELISDIKELQDKLDKCWNDRFEFNKQKEL